MNLSKSTSGSTYSSCKNEENGVASTESDRPLKKARFAWEVKGKYYLKNDISDNKSEISSPDSSETGSSLETKRECEDINLNIQQNHDKVGDLPKQDLFTLYSTPSLDQQQFPNISISQENINSPQFGGDDEHYFEYENQSLEVWQQEQMTKCLIENSLNSYYECTNLLLPNLSSDQQVEDEGILMAISTHGLQNTSSSSDYETDDTSTSPSSSINSEYLDSCNKNLKERLCTQSRNLSNCSFTSHSSIDNIDDYYGGIDMNTHYDFLDTAVSFAIQYKGLTPHGTDYG